MKEQCYHIIYLHGFASGPDSRKARYFKRRLEVHGYELVIPDLNLPSFNQLSVHEMVHSVQQTIKKNKSSKWVIIASSLGALVGLQLARLEPRVEKLILIAPAFGFYQRKEFIIGKDKLEQWKSSGEIPIYHHHLKKEVPISYRFMEEMEKMNEYDFNREMPIKIFHGAFDDVVNFEHVEKFAAPRNYVEYHLLESDHSLMSKLDWIWRDMLTFIPITKRKK